METWEDTGIVLSVRPHGDTGAIVSLLTQEHGRYSGYVYGGQSSRLRGVLQEGNIVAVEWKSRIKDSLGQYKLELVKSSIAAVLSDRSRLQALQAACIIADKTLSEREVCEAVFLGFKAFLESLELSEDDIWLASYIYWEIGILRELGFGLDFTSCALTGTTENLAYVSPKTGRVASKEAGDIYKDKLLELPEFLVGGENLDKQEILKGLKLTGYFLKNKVFAQMYQNIPEPRQRLEEIIAA